MRVGRSILPLILQTRISEHGLQYLEIHFVGIPVSIFRRSLFKAFSFVSGRIFVSVLCLSLATAASSSSLVDALDGVLLGRSLLLRLLVNIGDIPLRGSLAQLCSKLATLRFSHLVFRLYWVSLLRARQACLLFSACRRRVYLARTPRSERVFWFHLNLACIFRRLLHARWPDHNGAFVF